MRLVWYQRQDQLWNAACACHATVCGVPFERRGDAEISHFKLAAIEREQRASRPWVRSQIPACGPVGPEDGVTDPDEPLVDNRNGAQ